MAKKQSKQPVKESAWTVATQTLEQTIEADVPAISCNTVGTEIVSVFVGHDGWLMAEGCCGENVNICKIEDAGPLVEFITSQMQKAAAK